MKRTFTFGIALLAGLSYAVILGLIGWVCFEVVKMFRSGQILF